MLSNQLLVRSFININQYGNELGGELLQETDGGNGNSYANAEGAPTRAEGLLGMHLLR